MDDGSLATVLLAMFAGAIRVSTPFLFVSLGECLTEKSGRINLGLEGTLVFGAMSGYALSFHTGSPWIGVLGAGVVGVLFGAIHGYLCKLPKVNDIAIGIALMLFGTGAAFFFGKAYIQPQAARLPSISLVAGPMTARCSRPSRSIRCSSSDSFWLWPCGGPSRTPAGV